MNKNYKKYAELGKQYYEASKLLSDAVFNNKELTNPLLFLLRQSLELYLKASIFYLGGEIPKQKGHDLKVLFSTIIKNDNTLIHFFDKNSSSLISETINLYSKFRSDADWFRYPKSFKGHKRVESNLFLESSDISPEIGKTPIYISQSKDELYILRSNVAARLISSTFKTITIIRNLLIAN